MMTSIENSCPSSLSRFVAQESTANIPSLMFQALESSAERTWKTGES